MNTERISGGHSAAAQVMVLVTNLSFLFFLIRLEIQSANVGLEELCFVLLIILFVVLIVKNAVDFYDISIVDDECITIKNIFTKKVLYPTEEISVRSGVLPFVFYIKQGESRYYFFLRTSLLFSSIFTLEPKKDLILLKKKIENIGHKKSNTPEQ